MRPKGDDIWLIHHGGVLEIMLNKQVMLTGHPYMVSHMHVVMCGLVYAVHSYINSGGMGSHTLNKGIQFILDSSPLH